MTDDELAQMLVNLATINHQLSDENFLKKLNGDILSYTAVKVAAMKATLIEFKVVAHQHMLDMEVEKDRLKALAYYRFKEELGPNGRPHGATAASDMKYMDEAFIEAQNNFNKAKVSYEQLKSVTADAHDLVDSIKSRVIDLQTSRKDER